jgi:peroxiredoxin
VQKRQQEIEQLGGQIVAVSFTPAARARAFLEQHPIPVPVLCDPNRDAYRAFQLGRTSWLRMLNPLVVGRYLLILLRGRRPFRPQKGDDLMQLGGDFVLDAERRLVYAHGSTEATDRPDVEELIKAVAACGVTTAQVSEP